MELQLDFHSPPTRLGGQKIGGQLFFDEFPDLDQKRMVAVHEKSVLMNYFPRQATDHSPAFFPEK
jgi:hypothetical protein